MFLKSWEMLFSLSLILLEYERAHAKSTGNGHGNLLELIYEPLPLSTLRMVIVLAGKNGHSRTLLLSSFSKLFSLWDGFSQCLVAWRAISGFKVNGS